MSFKDISKSAQDIRANNYELAQRRMEQLQAEVPYSVDSYLNMSTISSMQGNITDGVESIKKALQMDPFDFRPYYNLFVIYWRSNQHNLAFANLKKCLSILYTLKVNHNISDNQLQDLHRAIALWGANTPAYALKIIKLIKQDKLGEANQVVGQGLQKCIMKHHIYALGCVVDSKMNREAQRLQNARDYHAHLLRPVQVDDDDQNSSALTRQQINYLMQEFNQTSASFQVGQCKRYASHPKIMFVCVQRKTTINIEALIANLGGYELSCIKEEVSDSLVNSDENITKVKQQNTQNNIQEIKSSSQQQEQNRVKQNVNNKSQQNREQEQFKLPQQQDIPIPISTEFISSTQKIKVIQDELVDKLVTNQLNLQQSQAPKQKGENQEMQNVDMHKKEKEHEKQEHEKEEEKQKQQKQIKQEKQQEKEENKIIKQKSIEMQIAQKGPQIQKDKQQHLEKFEQEEKDKGLKKGLVSIEDELRQVNNQKDELLYPVTHSNFEIKLIMADLEISQELIGKMDPYVYYEYGQQKHKTTIAKRQGTRPRWQNQVKIFSLERNPTIMKISVYDRQIFKWDDLVGSGEFQIIKCGVHNIPIFLKGKQSGEVVVYISKVL